MRSKFSILLFLFGTLVILLSIYQWQPWITKIAKFPDPSQLFFGILIGIIILVYAISLWRKKENSGFDKKHIEQHREIAKILETLKFQYLESKDLSEAILTKFKSLDL